MSFYWHLFGKFPGFLLKYYLNLSILRIISSLRHFACQQQPASRTQPSKSRSFGPVNQKVGKGTNVHHFPKLRTLWHGILW